MLNRSKLGRHGDKALARKFETADGGYSDTVDNKEEWKSDDWDKDIAVARTAWAFAQEAMAGKRYDILVLDEFTYPLEYGMIDLDPVLASLANRPAALHVVIIGRGASPALVEAADLVTEMRAVKHPLKAGIKAQKGVEF